MKLIWDGTKNFAVKWGAFKINKVLQNKLNYNIVVLETTKIES